MRRRSLLSAAGAARRSRRADAGQSGLPDDEAAIRWGGPARRGIPAAVRERPNAAVRAAVTEARLAPALAAEGAVPGVFPPAQADRYVPADLARRREAAAAANTRVE
ncbi:hypothetical protein M0638_16900 [Roseomonas sp. NAR14]|uniref:Uncharacterized protein n=1 Tax=Roseomonas acroporae TaxID=2937791 RepID=A0A9X2BUY1_9PROT|nr:hypothetical protein [Roseomonas acroporae]MCK8786057.1 hypothetical protein [Roseomonas acroporae]